MDYSRNTISGSALTPIVTCANAGFAACTARRMRDSAHMNSSCTPSAGSHLYVGYVVGLIQGRQSYKRIGRIPRNETKPNLLELWLLYLGQYCTPISGDNFDFMDMSRHAAVGDKDVRSYIEKENNRATHGNDTTTTEDDVILRRLDACSMQLAEEWRAECFATSAK